MRKLLTVLVAVSLLSALAIFAAPRKVTKDGKEVKENPAAAKTAKDQKQKQQANKQQTSKPQTKK